MSDQTKGNKPIFTYKAESVKGQQWRNVHEKSVSYNSTITRSYKDKEGNWKETNQFSGSQLLNLGKVAEKLFENELKEKAKDRENAAEKTAENSKTHGRER